MGPINYAIAFDIDGVLRLGSKPLPCAGDALRCLRGGVSDAQSIVDSAERADVVPHIFLTNGHGTEIERARSLLKETGVVVSPDQLVVACTPLPELAADILDKPVLVVGDPGHALHFGFKEPVSVRSLLRLSKSFPLEFIMGDDDLLRERPDFTAISDDVARERIHRGICGVVVVGDDLFLPSLQAVLDVIATRGRTLPEDFAPCEPDLDLPIVFTNPDLTYGWHYPLPRMTQGSLRACLEALCVRQFGELPRDIRGCGKPTLSTGRVGVEKLTTLCSQLGCVEARRVYVIGDSPTSDMRMASVMREAGYDWRGVLVRTGIGRLVDVDSLPPEQRPDYVADDALAAVRMIVKLEGSAPMEPEESVTVTAREARPTA